MKSTEIQLNQKHNMDMKVCDLPFSQFVQINKDRNPIHFSNKYCRSNSIFNKKVVPGTLITSFFSNIIGNHLPGPGSVLVKQEFNFKEPIYFEGSIKLEVKVSQILKAKNIFKLQTLCTKDNGELAIDGISYVYNKIV